jgi:homoserine kinase
MQQVTVRVPASTSNLGPGFDCLGVALRIYNRVTVTKEASSEQLYPQIVSDAAGRFFKQLRRRSFRFSVSTLEKIPRSRGVGSSATVRLGTLEGLNQLSGAPLDRPALFRMCAELEGHPDNAAPAAFGGFTVVSGSPVRRNWLRPALPGLQRFAVSPRLYFVLLVPSVEIPTSIARKLLPSKISHAAAVENCGNACGITAAFASRKYENMRGLFVDCVHQPFRAKLIPFLPDVIAAAEKAGAIGAFLSGSGSIVCAITLEDPGRIATAMKRAIGSRSADVMITRADNHGAHVMPSPISSH